ncbi:amino acid ABC transporter permease [Bacilliculturomica massiliensis]|uniref:amino acid ABC transporter permease n=1 Tax=Bacilliculturomica massiliensis TaxID=1917867 RepID=UPI00102FE054|nr:amino acid ABC transporter permease [Bacilliculturomica massiliensis]
MDYILEILPYIWGGAANAFKVYGVTIVCAIPLGIICAMGRLSKFKPLSLLIDMYTWLFRGTPLMLQLFFFYFGLMNVYPMPALTAACVTFVINYTAYFTEIFRAGIQSIDKGQYEAAKALGMTYGQTMKRIVIPQGVKVVIPPLGNEAITLIKDTALISVISLADITKNAKVVAARDFDITSYVVAALIYLAITFVIINVFRQIEKKFAYYR